MGKNRVQRLDVNCMMCLAHIVDGAPHEGEVYIEHGVIHATEYNVNRSSRALVCTLKPDKLQLSGWHGYEAKWVG